MSEQGMTPTTDTANPESLSAPLQEAFADLIDEIQAGLQDEYYEGMYDRLQQIARAVEGFAEEIRAYGEAWPK